LAFTVIIAFVVTGFSSSIGTGTVLLRNYGFAVAIISVVFTRTANHDDLHGKNKVAHSLAFKLGLANVGVTFLFFTIFALML
jgi:hypothetical protein